MSNKTLIILKPDAVKRKLVGEIISRIESKNLNIVQMDQRVLDEDLLAKHYEEHVEKPFYPELVSFMTSGPVVILEVQGREAQSVMRTMMGSTDPALASPGTIRGDYGIEMGENLIHGSDSPESADREIALFFS